MERTSNKSQHTKLIQEKKNLPLLLPGFELATFQPRVWRSNLPAPDYATVQAECGNLSGNELTCNSPGNTRLQSSQLAEPLWTDPGLKSGFSLRELISTNVEHSPQSLAHEEKATTTTTTSTHTLTPPSIVCTTYILCHHLINSQRVKEWATLPMPMQLETASHRKDWKRISHETFPMFLRTTQSVVGLK